MCPVTLAALLGVAASGCAPDTLFLLLATADLRIDTRWSPPPIHVAGLKRLTPVDPKDWRDLNRDGLPDGGTNGGMGGGK